jgi:VanZ family protein
MLPLRYARTWLVAGLILLAIGLVAALEPVPSAVAVTFNDKFIHITGFLVFMVWFGGIFEGRFAPVIAAALSSYGILIELLQSLTPTRSAEALDVVADVVGVLLGWALSAAGLSRWCAKIESWLVRPGP